MTATNDRGPALRGQAVNPRRTTVRDVRRGNRAALLRMIYLDGPLSRFELSRLTGLSQATVSNLVTDMLTEGLVIEGGLVDSDGGRPRVLLTVNPGYGHVIGVDVGETQVRVELFTLDLAPVSTAEFPLEPDLSDIDAVVRHILSGIEATLARSGLPESAVLGVGIGVPGIVEQGDEPLVHGQTIGWPGVPLTRLLAVGTALPIFVDNGAKTMGQAELWWGAGRGVQHAVMVLIGSGVGASIIADGATYRGASSSAGEWGHTTISVGGRRCRCGNQGCLEAYIGAGPIIDRCRAAVPQPPPDTAPQERALEAVLDAAAGSAAIAEVVDATVEYLGAGLANLINLFNPERLVIGGWAGLMLGRRHLPAIRLAAQRQALRHPSAQATIELGHLGTDAVALGAATLVVEHVLGGTAGIRQADRTPGGTVRLA
jgi:predicted NBD/HSP70 family sugar kinase